MKNFFIFLLFLGLIPSMQAQKFGVRAGADFATAKAEFDGLSISEDETGFYVGAFARFSVSESFNLRPEFNFISINDMDQIQVPVLAEIGISDKFNLVAGPSFGFLLDTDSNEGEKSFNFGLDFGLSYDIISQLSIEARYSLGLSNLVEDNDFDVELKLHGLFVGLGYVF
ncbi:porin family protein [Gaetbulibacter sp. M240]|uniref:porin family protein n=1 Tax=Gaetbulibacter sp. M240 TaxID=3126511 RepID=UPI00374F08CA